MEVGPFNAPTVIIGSAFSAAVSLAAVSVSVDSTVVSTAVVVSVISVPGAGEAPFSAYSQPASIHTPITRAAIIAIRFFIFYPPCVSHGRRKRKYFQFQSPCLSERIFEGSAYGFCRLTGSIIPNSIETDKFCKILYLTIYYKKRLGIKQSKLALFA